MRKNAFKSKNISSLYGTYKNIIVLKIYTQFSILRIQEIFVNLYTRFHIYIYIHRVIYL